MDAIPCTCTIAPARLTARSEEDNQQLYASQTAESKAAQPIGHTGGTESGRLSKGT